MQWLALGFLPLVFVVKNNWSLSVVCGHLRTFQFTERTYRSYFTKWKVDRHFIINADVKATGVLLLMTWKVRFLLDSRCQEKKAATGKKGENAWFRFMVYHAVQRLGSFHLALGLGRVFGQFHWQLWSSDILQSHRHTYLFFSIKWKLQSLPANSIYSSSPTLMLEAIYRLAR